MKIIAAAIAFPLKNENGDEYIQIMSGKRHCDVYELMFKKQIKLKPEECIEGFLTDDYQFLNRYDAIEYAKQSGQLDSKFSETILFSEDLW